MRLNDKDNVEVDLSTGHKIALYDIAKGEKIIKYGFPIGEATGDIARGASVHTHNLKTLLGDCLEYVYAPKNIKLPGKTDGETFMGYRRKDGSVGIRNDIWIVNTVGCVNKVAERLAKETGAFCFTHPYGCSQLGDDMRYTQQILKGMVNHPNAGGVLVLGLGCENNNIDVFKKVLGSYDAERVRFLNTQDTEDEITDGIRIINELKAYADTFKRTPCSVSELKLGLKCGGSDGYSGITANPLVGRVSDMLIEKGGSAILTEVPEMFGAEQLLMDRCVNKTVFDKTVDMINSFKNYYKSHGLPVYENPSPGNKAGGITTLEEKSLGCVQKGGFSAVMDVLKVGDTVGKGGLYLLDGPGNDIVAITNLMASGAQLILFTTGRGTPLGGAVPTLKIASNSKTANTKRNWMDFNAGRLLENESMASLADELYKTVIETANGRRAKNEENGYREIAIFKNGVTL